MKKLSTKLTIGVVTNDQKLYYYYYYILNYIITKLYKSELPSNMNKITRTSFLNRLDFPTLSVEDQELPDSPLKLSELEITLAAMERGKAAGPATFYLPPFLKMLEEAFKTNSLPPSLSKALIMNILMPGKPPSKCESYRLISLLNADAKLIKS